MKEAGIDPSSVKGIGFDATCSLVALDKDTDEPISVAGPDFTESEKNVICECYLRPSRRKYDG